MKAVVTKFLPESVIKVCRTEKSIQEVEKAYGVLFERKAADAWASCIENDKSGDIVLVMFISKKKRSRVQTDALVAHESYHLACRYYECLGEEKPGEEIMAYTVQEIAQSAFDALHGN
jgi:hypothetical protein